MKLHNFLLILRIIPSSSQAWYTFINNDGDETSFDERKDSLPAMVKEFGEKTLAFAHWVFDQFSGKVLVCDLQGNFAIHSSF